MNVFTASQQMFVMFLLIIIGYLCHHYKLITAENNSFLSSLVVNIFNPATIFASVLANSGKRTVDSLATVFAVGLGIYLFLILTAKILVHFTKGSLAQKCITELMYVFANVGFIGIPIVKALLGSDKLIYVAVFILYCNILIYTYGTHTLIRGTGKESSSGFHLSSLKPLINMGTIACTATLIVFLGGFSLPAPITDTFQTLANVTTPLSLMIIGVSVGVQGDILALFTNARRYLFCL